jgi:thiol-disulfide isomerase/thioredoxin
MNKNSGIKVNDKNSDPQDVNSLYENQTPIFIKLYADWCGHCQTLAPIWNQVEQECKNTFADQPLAIVSIENGTFDKFKNNQMDDLYNNVIAPVKGYPTIGAITNKKFVPYEGERTKEAMLDFINNKVVDKKNNKHKPSKPVKQDGGRKSKMRKHKSRKYKTRKHKTRKSKTRKSKTRKHKRS